MTNNSLIEFADKLDQIMPAIMREYARRQTDELSKGKITVPQFIILDHLNKSGESKMTDLAHFMKVTTAAMTGFIDRLVKCNFVTRVFNPDDRRIVKIRILPKGKDLVKRINEQRRQMTIKIFGKISQTERSDYLKILVRIHEILSKEV